MKEFGGRTAPEASQRNIRDVPGTSGTFGPMYAEIPVQGAECPQTDGTYDGTDGMCPWDRRDTHTHTHHGVSHQNSLCLLVFLSPSMLKNDICFFCPQGSRTAKHGTYHPCKSLKDSLMEGRNQTRTDWHEEVELFFCTRLWWPPF